MKYKFFIFLLSCAASLSAATFDAKLMDFHYRIFPDRFPDEASYNTALSMPRNYEAGYQLAVRSSSETTLYVRLENTKNENTGQEYSFKFSVRQLLTITCEGNTQGSMINEPGGTYPASWTPYFIRNAPFDLLEAVSDPSADGSLQLPAGKTSGALLQIFIPEDCPLGLYTGNIIVEQTAGDRIVLPVSFKVHKALVDRNYFLDCVHWLSAIPTDLRTNGSSVAWWSEEHWNLLERVGRKLYEDGNNMMLTPLVNTDNPLIPSSYHQGVFSFDYTHFDRWINLFQSCGFKWFAGYHLRYAGLNLKVKDTANGDVLKTVDQAGSNIGCFLGQFLHSLDQHLYDIGLHDHFVMHVYDEPALAGLDEYIHYNDFLERYTSGIPSIDATNSSPQRFSDYVEFQVYNLPGIVVNKNGTVASRIAEGKPVWLYNTSSPFPPYPNRHIDRPLTENRLWPMLALNYKCSGYLFWAVNTYRGVPNEYATSLGPLPDGTQKHAPGDAWFYYRTSTGLIQSLRLMSFREGMIDVSLLKMLEQYDPAQIKIQLSKLIKPEIEIGQNRPFSDYLIRADEIPKGYVSDSEAYYANRKEILEFLDQVLP